MNREILFKAKRKDNGEWVEGLPGYDINGNITELEVYKKFSDCRIYEINPDTLCQYIGKTDKKNRKIFENDIVKDGKWLGKIVCRYSNFEMDLFKYSKVTGKYFAVFARNCFEVEEVIGNIFDNPELFEVEREK